MINKAKKLIGKECKIRLISEQNRYGKIIEASKIWLLVENIEDFRIDGYCFYVWEVIANIWYRQQEKFTEKIKKRKAQYQDDTIDKIWIEDFSSFFYSIRHTLMMIETKRWKNIFCKIVNINEKDILVKNFDSYGKREKKEERVQYKNIFCVEFSNDYLMTFKKYMEKEANMPLQK